MPRLPCKMFEIYSAGSGKPLESFKHGDVTKLAFWKDDVWQLCEEWIGGERHEKQGLWW